MPRKADKRLIQVRCLGSLWFFCHGVFDEQFQGDQWVNRSTRLNDQLARTLDAVEAVSVLNFMMNSDVGCRIVLRTKVVSLKVLPCNQITTTVSHVRAQIL